MEITVIMRLKGKPFLKSFYNKSCSPVLDLSPPVTKSNLFTNESGLTRKPSHFSEKRDEWKWRAD